VVPRAPRAAITIRPPRLHRQQMRLVARLALGKIPITPPSASTSWQAANVESLPRVLPSAER
jgi:hypothetical protein